jgi:hypothetical protein
MLSGEGVEGHPTDDPLSAVPDEIVPDGIVPDDDEVAPR